jgi:DNA-binding ferritin-like protein (Dps family)
MQKMTNTDEKEMWKAHKREVNIMRKKRSSQFRDIIKEFRELGFEVKELNQFQFRFNGIIDIYPSNKRFHDLKNNIRGDIRGKNFNDFLRSYFNLK